MQFGNKASAREIDKFRNRARIVVNHHFGTSARRLVHESGGLTNFVFSFSNSDGDFIIRISPDPARISSFMKEQWAETAAREAGVPMPEILEVGSDLIQFPYMISRTAEGSSATDHPRRLDILREMGRYATMINSIKTKGFGQTFDWSVNQLSHNATFKDYLYDEYRFEEKLAVFAKHKMIQADRSKKLARIFADAAKLRIRPVLNHGDIRLKNVIADEDGKINALIDWEGCTSNFAPAWELSIALHDLGVDEMQHFLDGYGITAKRLSDSLPLIRAFNITNYASAVENAAAARDKRLLAHYRIRLAGNLDLYSL
jgi:aminoglycoside phosphotransferase (APT) family kinase protein